MGAPVQNDTDAIESSLIDDNFDSLDSTDSAATLLDESQTLANGDLTSDGLNASIQTSDDLTVDVIPSDVIPSDVINSISIPPVDFTAFRSLPFDDVLSNAILVLSIVGFLAAGLYMTGAAMKLACRITGGRRITVRRGIIATILMSAAYALAAFVTTGFSSTPSLLFTFTLQVAVGTFVLGLLLWQNPIRALATGVVASILQTIFLFGVFAASIILIGQFVPTTKLKQLAEHTQSFTDSLAKEVLPGDEEKTRQLLSIKSLVESPSGQASASGAPKAKPIYERNLRNNPFVE